MMLVEGRIQARAIVDEAALAHPGAAEGVAQKLIRAVIGEADKSAYKVSPDSVHVRRVDERDETRHRVFFIGTWSPRTALLVGGEYDGDTINLDRDPATGLPLDVLRLPYRDSSTFLGADAPIVPPAPAQHPAYRRVGTHPIDDVWVYEHLR